jgi:hypothetical protein
MDKKEEEGRWDRKDEKWLQQSECTVTEQRACLVSRGKKQEISRGHCLLYYDSPLGGAVNQVYCVGPAFLYSNVPLYLQGLRKPDASPRSSHHKLLL